MPKKKQAANKPAAKLSPPTRQSGAQRYETIKAATLDRNRKASAEGRDIGDIPPIEHARRRSDAEKSFRLFCESYLSATFCLEWSQDHLETIAAVEAAVLRGELLAFAMPRGSGKTSLVEAASLWAILCGHREFVTIIGSDEGHASTMLESIKVECETNDLLLADFPEAIFPITALERIHQRAKGQLYKGKPTHIAWTADEVQFPTIPGSKASGGIIRVAGITGRIRGMTAKRAGDGRKVRPSLVLIDDPQTDDSARSPAQTAAREAVLKGAILGLAGPGVRISGLATVTVIHRDDLADRLLDRQRHPAWHGRRMKLVYRWPESTSLWDTYAELRRRGQRDGAGTMAADEFYAANQEAMDAGAVVAWPARKHADELTALQHAWNLRIDRGEGAFAAEFQNEPLEDASRSDAVAREDVKPIGVPRWTVPRGLDTLTAFVDVQQDLLYWSVVAWGSQLRGHVVAYGAYPDQGRSYFTLRDARKTLANAHGSNVEAAILAGLEAVAASLLDRDFVREDDDAAMRVGQLFVDANWAQTAGVVRDFARRSRWGPRVLPTHGRFVGASGQTISDKRPDAGERIGPNWRTSTIGKQRHVLYDTNWWKSFVAARLKLPLGDPQGLTVHAGEHDMIAEQYAAEVPTRVESKMRIVDEWRLTPGRDNHLWDCLVGSAVAASFVGVSAIGAESRPVAVRRLVSREDMQARRDALMRQKGL